MASRSQAILKLRPPNSLDYGAYYKPQSLKHYYRMCSICYQYQPSKRLCLLNSHTALGRLALMSLINEKRLIRTEHGRQTEIGPLLTNKGH